MKRSTQPSIPPGLVNEYRLRLGRQRQVWFIQTADERVGVQVKLWNPLRTRAIPERLCGGDSLRRGAISSVCTFTFTFRVAEIRSACRLYWWEPVAVLDRNTGGAVLQAITAFCSVYSPLTKCPCSPQATTLTSPHSTACTV